MLSIFSPNTSVSIPELIKALLLILVTGQPSISAGITAFWSNPVVNPVTDAVSPLMVYLIPLLTITLLCDAVESAASAMVMLVFFAVLNGYAPPTSTRAITAAMILLIFIFFLL